MNGYFEENRNFLGLKGILGRRDFIVNCLIIEIIEIVLSTPLFYIVMLRPDLLDATVNHSSIGILLAQAMIGLIISPLYFSSITRRVRDILGEEDDNRIYIISAILTVLLFMAYTPVSHIFLAKWLIMFIIIMLMFWEGKISSQKPKSEIVKFNWGACFGTWIWGLFNKTPVTLLMIPLCLTFGWLPFMIICGLKGNEWAYEHKKYDSVEKFHKSQFDQSVIFTVLTPILFIIGSLSAMVISGTVLYKYTKANPEFAKKLDNSLVRYQEISINSVFDKVELTKDEYKFYLSPDDWADVPKKSRIMIFKTAVNYVAAKEDGALKLSDVDKPLSEKQEKFKSVIEFSNKTKILSTFNNEVLAEYYLDPQAYTDFVKDKKNVDLKGLYKLIDSGYKFNEHPSIP